jgi:carboxyl-terminal processing protease
MPDFSARALTTSSSPPVVFLLQPKLGMKSNRLRRLNPRNCAPLLLPLILFSASLVQASTLNCNAVLESRTDWWSETGITWERLKFFDRDAKECWKKPEAFIACWMAAEKLADEAGLSLAVSLKDGAMERVLFASSDAIVEFQPFRVMKKDPRRPSTFELEIGRRRIFHYLYKAMFEELKGAETTRSAFSLLVNYLKTLILRSPHSSRSIGLAFAAYRDATDPYFGLLPISEAEILRGRGQDEKEGYGISGFRVGKSRILLPMPNSPAAKAGLQRFDEPIRINGRKMESVQSVEFARLLRGEPGAELELTVRRDDKVVDLTIPFGSTPVVESRIIGVGGTSYGYVQLTHFPNQLNCFAFARAIRELERQGARGIVLDLRGNIGGSTFYTACVGGVFIGEKAVAGATPRLYVSRRKLYGGKFIAPREAFESQTDLPLAILVDEASISASEILAGSLQDYHRAWIVGRKTFGKGAYGWIFDDPSKKFATVETIADYVLPSRRKVDRMGIAPDFLILQNGVKAVHFRAEDLYIGEENSFLSTNDVVDWKNPRKAEIDRIDDCVLQDWKVGPQADRQLEYAMRVLKCADQLQIRTEPPAYRALNFNNGLVLWKARRYLAKKLRENAEN